MIMCVLLCYPVSILMSQLLSTGRPISSSFFMCQEPRLLVEDIFKIEKKKWFDQTKNEKW